MANVYLTAWDAAVEVAVGDVTDNLVAVIGTGVSGELTSSRPQTPKQRKRVRLLADDDCFVVFWKDGADPDINDGDDALPLGANNPEYFDMQAGRVLKAIART